METIAVRSRRWHDVLLLLGALTFVAGGIFILVLSEKTKDTFVGLSCIVFFGGCALVAVKELVDKRPRVVISDAGVLDRSLKVGVIPWTDILDAHVGSIQGRFFVALRLRNPADYVARLGPVTRRLAELNAASGMVTFNVNVTGIDADPYHLAELIVREAERHRIEPTTAYR